AVRLFVEHDGWTGSADNSAWFGGTEDNYFAGKVGIGTTDPGSSKLKVQGNLTVTGSFSASSNTSGERTLLMEAPNSNNHRGDGTQGATGLVYRVQSNPNAGEPIFQVRSEGEAVRLFVEHDGWTGSADNSAWFGGTRDNYFAGSLGIGTTDPGSSKLKVQGKLTVSAGEIQLDGAQQIVFTNSDTTNNLKLQLWDGYGLGINSQTLFYAANGNHSWRDTNGTNERMVLTTAANGGLTVKGTGNSSFAGSLGIGITGPSKKLHVESGELRVRASHNNADADIGAFYAQNLTQGIGIGYNRIEAIGSNTDQDINLIPKGNGELIVDGIVRAKDAFRPSTNDWEIARNGENLEIREPEESNKVWARFTDDESFHLIGTPNLLVDGEIRAGNSDIYFTKTNHNHTGIGNADGYAAIENAANHDALMILGRSGTSVGRQVKLWDYLKVHGSVSITNSLYVGSLPYRDDRNVQWDDSTKQICYDNSSARSKENIISLEDDFSKILTVEPKTYTRPNHPNRWEIGYIAEELHEIGLNKLVYYDQQGLPEAINYRKISMYLVEVIKDMAHKSSNYEQRINQLELQLNQLVSDD
ncbi:MAG: tail fiber domain-containing protein, partial [Moorea sp. SIO3E2]|nr:tail fiber domain-containing protein [Moorena sp. SIO3E2]